MNNKISFNKKNKIINSKKDNIFKVNDINFPLLIKTENNREVKSFEFDKVIIDFKEAVNIENITINNKDDKDLLDEGYVKYYYDNNNIQKIDNNVNKNVNKNVNNNYNFNDIANKHIENMIDRWDNYKLNYISMYGEDIYIKTYLFPNNESYGEDSDSDSDSDSINNDEYEEEITYDNGYGYC